MTKRSPEEKAKLLARLAKILDADTLSAIRALDAEIQISEGMDFGEDRYGPVREILRLIGDSWSSLIVQVLETGAYRHSALRTAISYLAVDATLSQRMMTLKLRRLEANGLVGRREIPGKVLHVEYALTALGQELATQVRQLVAWIQAHREEIEKARETARPEAH